MTEHPALEELIARIGGPAGADPHLSACPACRAEVHAWSAVAAGVQLLAAQRDVPPPRPVARPRWALAAPAAAAALIVAGVAGTVAVSLSSLPGPVAGSRSAGAALLSIRGCPGTPSVAAGTLARVSGSSLVVTSAPTGQPVTVTTSASTRVIHEADAGPGAVHDGDRVLVTGPRSADGGIAARQVMLNLPPGPPDATGPAGTPPPGQPTGFAAGTVRDAHDGSFTVVTRSGAAVPVTATAGTRVIASQTETLDQLQAGRPVAVVGSSANGGLDAALIAQSDVAQPAWTVVVGDDVRPALGCDPAVLAAAVLNGRAG